MNKTITVALTAQAVAYLRFLAENPDSTATQAAQELGVKEQAASQFYKRHVAKGLVVASSSPKGFELTEAGRAALIGIEPDENAPVDQAAEALAPVAEGDDGTHHNDDATGAEEAALESTLIEYYAIQTAIAGLSPGTLNDRKQALEKVIDADAVDAVFLLVSKEKELDELLCGDRPWWRARRIHEQEEELRREILELRTELGLENSEATGEIEVPQPKQSVHELLQLLSAEGYFEKRQNIERIDTLEAELGPEPAASVRKLAKLQTELKDGGWWVSEAHIAERKREIATLRISLGFEVAQ